MRRHLPTFYMVLLNMLVTILGAAFVGLVALQVRHHVKTGGKLFFQPPDGCLRLRDGNLECLNATDSSSFVPVDTVEPQEQPLLEMEIAKAEGGGEPSNHVKTNEAEVGNDDPPMDQQLASGDDGPSPAATAKAHQLDATNDAGEDNPSHALPTANDIYIAANEGKAELLQEYFTLNPELVNIADHNKWTALHMAARAGFTDIVRLLLRAGANTELRTATGKTALTIAMERLAPDHAVIDLLKGPVLILQNGQLVTADEFRFAADRGQVDKVQHYLSEAFDINGTGIMINHGDGNRWNALHMAARSGHARVVKLLVEAGADPSLRTANQKTALAIAVEKHGTDNEIVDILRSVLADEL